MFGNPSEGEEAVDHGGRVSKVKGGLRCWNILSMKMSRPPETCHVALAVWEHPGCALASGVESSGDCGPCGMPLTALSSLFFPKSTPGLRLWTLVGLQGAAHLQTGAPGPAGASAEGAVGLPHRKITVSI